MKRLWLAILGLVSWLSGFCGYNLILWFVWKQTDSDLIPALFITGITFFVIQFPLCLMSIRAVNRVIHHFKCLFFPLGCLMSFTVPTVLVFACKGGPLQMIYSKDSVSFLEIPVLYNADIGHMPPQIILVNGAWASITSDNGKGLVDMTFK